MNLVKTEIQFGAWDPGSIFGQPPQPSQPHEISVPAGYENFFLPSTSDQMYEEAEPLQGNMNELDHLSHQNERLLQNNSSVYDSKEAKDENSDDLDENDSLNEDQKVDERYETDSLRSEEIGNETNEIEVLPEERENQDNDSLPDENDEEMGEDGNAETDSLFDGMGYGNGNAEDSSLPNEPEDGNIEDANENQSLTEETDLDSLEGLDQGGDILCNDSHSEVDMNSEIPTFEDSLDAQSPLSYLQHNGQLVVIQPVGVGCDEDEGNDSPREKPTIPENVEDLNSACRTIQKIARGKIARSSVQLLFSQQPPSPVVSPQVEDEIIFHQVTKKVKKEEPQIDLDFESSESFTELITSRPSDVTHGIDQEIAQLEKLFVDAQQEFGEEVISDAEENESDQGNSISEEDVMEDSLDQQVAEMPTPGHMKLLAILGDDTSDWNQMAGSQTKIKPPSQPNPLLPTVSQLRNLALEAPPVKFSPRSKPEEVEARQNGTKGSPRIQANKINPSRFVINDFLF
jgi:hypothetical protein